MKPQLHYIHADAQIGKTYYLWGFNILCLLFRGDAAILIVCGEISYGKHKKLSHPFLGVGFSATRTIWVSCLSHFLLLPCTQDKFVMAVAPGHAPLHAI